MDGGIIKVSGKAASQLKELMKAQGGLSGLRIKVFNGGCAGLKYQPAFDECPEKVDEVFWNPMA